jgi:hypothetical protein
MDRTTVGTPPNEATLYFSIKRIASAGSHLNCETMAPPLLVWDVMPHKPAMWKYGNVVKAIAWGFGAFEGDGATPAIFPASATANRPFQILVM